jgi:hypothetical protein
MRAMSDLYTRMARAGLTLLATSLLAACQTAKVTGEHELAAAPAGKPAAVYVADFDLGAQNIQHEENRLEKHPALLGHIGKRLSGESADPATRARQLEDLMANSLVEDLHKAGFAAARLAPGEATSRTRWLVRGVFTEVQEGNRLRRAVIGFGQGATDLQVITKVDNLSLGQPRPFYEVETEASSGQGPGAGPTIALGPYGAAARFVMAGKDVDQNVKQTAAQIADHVTKQVGQTQYGVAPKNHRVAPQQITLAD